MELAMWLVWKFDNIFILLKHNFSYVKDINAGLSPDKIIDSWQPELEDFKNKREQYLIY